MGRKTETAEILSSKELHPAVAQGDIDLVQALGFKDSEGEIDAGKAVP